jgi:type I restriction enzyme R subunit
MAYLSEAAVEQVVLDHLVGLGYAIATDAEIGPDGKNPEREAYADVVLIKRLTAAIQRLNPEIPAEARGDALRKVLATEKPSLVEENRRLHKLMVEGVDVEFYSEDGTIRGDKVRLIDFDDLAANDWLATGQFTVIEGSSNRRPDIVIFINGLPLGRLDMPKIAWYGDMELGAHMWALLQAASVDVSATWCTPLNGEGALNRKERARSAEHAIREALENH